MDCDGGRVSNAATGWTWCLGRIIATRQCSGGVGGGGGGGGGLEEQAAREKPD